MTKCKTTPVFLFGVCTFVSHLFCESTELSLQAMTREQIHPLLTSFLNSNKPRKTTTEEEHEQHDTFYTWKLHSWMSWVCKKLATHNSTKSSGCVWSASFLDQECPGNGHWLKPSSLPLVKLSQQGYILNLNHSWCYSQRSRRLGITWLIIWTIET